MSVQDIKDAINPQFYINRYPDIKNQFENNYIAAKDHFLQYGVFEKRYFNLHDEQIREGIAKNNTVKGEVYPFTNDYIKFTNMTTDPSQTESIGKFQNTEVNNCRLKCNENSECGGFTLEKGVVNNIGECTLWDTNLYADADMIKKENVEFYMRKREMRKFCDEECMNAKGLDKLEQEFDNIYDNMKTMPDRVDEIMKEIILKAEGPEFYKLFMEDQYKKQSDKIFNKVKKIYTKVYQAKLKIIENYKRKEDYLQLLKEESTETKNQNKLYLTKLEEKINEKNIDARKTYYEENETSGMSYYIELLVYFYYSLFIVYIYLFFVNKKYLITRNLILPVLYLILPYVIYFYVLYYLKMGIDYIIKMFPRNVYIFKEKE